jgi:hypothetical protein
VIPWLTATEIGLSVVVGLLCVVLGLAKRKPDDISLGATLLVELALIVQIVVAIVAPLTGNGPTGNPVEFWIYLGTAALLPPLGVIWGLIERTRWSTVVLGVASLAVAVMLYRMNVIWFVQLG